MKALLKVEWIKLWRTWPSLILSIGMPLGFFLFYSGMTMYSDAKQQTDFVKTYMLTMTGFSMSSFGFFTFPFMLVEDRTDHWRSFIQHSRLPIWQYALSKVFRVGLLSICAILVTFATGALVRGVEMPLSRWIGGVLLLLLAQLLFLSIGLLIAQIPSQELMSTLANIVFIGLAIIGGSWMPVSVFPQWLQELAKWTPIYHVNQVLTTWATDGKLLWSSLGVMGLYAIIAIVIAGWLNHNMEVA